MSTSQENAAAPRARRGRSKRQDNSAESTAQANSVPYIKRKLAPFEAVDSAAIDKIEAATDKLLEETGVDFFDDEIALQLWKDAGADVKGNRVRFPKGLIRQILKTAPSCFTQLARNPARSVEIGEDNIVFAPFYGAPFVRDMEKGRRYGTLEDFQNLVKMAYSIPTLHHSGGTVCEPVDIPVNKRHLDMVYAHFKYSDKAMMGSVTAPERAEDSIEMARLVFGRETVEQNCVILGNINVNSPLVFDGTMSGALRTYAAANQAAVVVPFILSGATGPVTLPGAIVQAHAETLVGCALTQLVRPGAPVIYGNFLSSMSLRTGAPTFGTPEPALGSLIVGQLARRNKLPLRCSGGFTTSKVADAQAMQESVMSMLAAVHCGANFILHSAGWSESALAVSYEKFMIDSDFLGALHVYLANVDINDDSLAVHAYDEVQPGQHFIGCAHTMQHYKTAFWDSALSDNNSFEQWSEDGSVQSEERAHKAFRKILADYEAPALDPSIDEALIDFVDRKKNSMADSWY